jgi:hypothetical protein
MSLTSRRFSSVGYLTGRAHPAERHLDTLHDEAVRVDRV